MDSQIYQAYLLRLWRESEASPWRAILEDPHTGERIGFGAAERLLAYLTQQLQPKTTPAPTPPSPADPHNS